MEGCKLKLKLEVCSSIVSLKVIRNYLLSNKLEKLEKFRAVCIDPNITNPLRAYRILVLYQDSLKIFDLNDKERYSIDLSLVSAFQESQQVFGSFYMTKLTSVFDETSDTEDQEPLEILLEEKVIQPFQEFFRKLRHFHLTEIISNKEKAANESMQRDMASLSSRVFEVEKKVMGFWISKFLEFDKAPLTLNFLKKSKTKEMECSFDIRKINQIQRSVTNKRTLTVSCTIGKAQTQLSFRTKNVEMTDEILKVFSQYKTVCSKLLLQRSKSVVNELNQKILIFDTIRTKDIAILKSLKAFSNFLAENTSTIAEMLKESSAPGLLKEQRKIKIEILNLNLATKKISVFRGKKKKSEFDVAKLKHATNDLCNLNALHLRNEDGSYYGVLLDGPGMKEMLKMAVTQILHPDSVVGSNDPPNLVPLRIFCGSFNSGMMKPNNTIQKTWLKDASDCDLVVIGLQESDNNEFLKHFMRHFRDTHSLVATSTMWQMSLTVFAKKSLEKFIGNVEIDQKPTGIAQIIGNKGGVMVTFTIFESSYCFISSHLAAGAKNCHLRQSNFYEIIKNLRAGDKDFEQISFFQHVFWFGDFNYRTNMPYNEVVELSFQGNFSEIIQTDQLKSEMKLNKVFSGFSEGPLTFRPTYRRLRMTNEDFSNKKDQSPSWTDRIMFKVHPGQKLDLESFNSHEDCFGSDHRPVSAIFNANYEMPYLTKTLLFAENQISKSNISLSEIKVIFEMKSLRILKDYVKIKEPCKMGISFDVNNYVSSRTFVTSQEAVLTENNITVCFEKAKINVIHASSGFYSNKCVGIVVNYFENDTSMGGRSSSISMKSKEVVFKESQLFSRGSLPMGYAFIPLLGTLKTRGVSILEEAPLRVFGVEVGRISAKVSLKLEQ